jgi:hypothetical protein
MKLFFLLCFLLIWTGCKPRMSENPNANAPTFSSEEFQLDLTTVVNSAEVLQLKKKIREEDRGVSIQNVQEAKLIVANQIESLERIDRKYSGRFRVREKNGDLRLIELAPWMKNQIQFKIQEMKGLLAELVEIEFELTGESSEDPQGL